MIWFIVGFLVACMINGRNDNMRLQRGYVCPAQPEGTGLPPPAKE